MDEAVLFLAVLETNLRAAGLEVAEVRARADFQPLSTAGRPELEIVFDHGRE